MLFCKAAFYKRFVLCRGAAAWLLILAASAGFGIEPSRAAAATDAGSVPDAAGIPQHMRLITQVQYVNTLHYIFGPDVRVDARFAPMARTQGLLENGAAFAGVTDAQMEQYQRTAALVASEVVDLQHRDFLIPCKPKDVQAADSPCARRFLTAVGRLLYRRPLSAAEAARFVEEADAGSDKLKGFYPGLAIALENMLMSPRVLFVTDTYERDPRHPGELRLDAYSLAQRLSFFLWNAGPDDDVLKAAESGEIQTPRGRERIVNLMLASPRLQVGMRAFFDDMLGFEDFDNLAKDPKVYPTFTGVTVADAREQTLRTIINHLIIEKKDYRDLFTTRETFLSPSLAALYGVPSGQGWTAYEFPADSGRAGILTHISFLAVHSHPGRSSPTRRGKALREIFLCQRVPTPPANVDFSALENPKVEQRTQRERVAFHLHNPVCAGCHRITDPIGLSLELFDGAGVYRTSEHGASIDASGALDGKSFKDAIGLAYALHDHPALTSCLVQRIYAYGSGGATTPQDQPLLTYLHQQFASEGFRLPDLLRTIALSDEFSRVRAPAPAEQGNGSPQTAANVHSRGVH
jgi:hypothetical protein